MEQIEKNEEKHIQEMIALMQQFLAKRDEGKTVERMFHPKMHGCVKASFTIEDDLPEELRRGLFARLDSYDAWVRFSSAPPRQKADYKASGRGVAIKITGVEGEFLDSSHATAGEQDFLLTTSPVLSPGTVANYKRSMVAITKGFPHNLPYLLTPTNWRRIYLTLKYMRKHQHLLEIPYFSGSPFLFGAGQAVKFSLQPVDPQQKLYPKDKSDHFLQERLQADLLEDSCQFNFLVQFQEDAHKEPVEDTSREWKTPFRKLAVLTIPSQHFLREERYQYGQKLVFSPWNGLAAHRPLGGINRARKAVYEALAAERSVR